MTTVVTGIFGGYDVPKPPLEQSVDCDFILYTDDPALEAPGWNKVCVPQDGRHPRLAAKEPKLRPWRHFPGPWIWIDGSFEITSTTFVAEAVEATTGPLGQWTHPWRDCVYAEASASIPLIKYANTPIRDQAASYRRLGHPGHWGLWATGLIVYTEPLLTLADLWWAELNRWGFQDQISQPVALAAAGLRPVALPGGLHQSPWLRWHSHRNEL